MNTRSVALAPVEPITELLRRRAVEDPDLLAFGFLRSRGLEIRGFSYAQIDEMARRFAATLAKRTAVGDRVLLLLPTGPEFVAALFGCLYSGRIAVPLYPPKTGRSSESQRRLAAVATDAAPTLAILPDAAVTAEGAEDLQASPLGAPIWITPEQCLRTSPCAAGHSPADESSIAFLQYTSGSTAAPKGVMVSHGNIAANERIIATVMEQTEQKAIAGWLPLFHDMGLLGLVMQGVFSRLPTYLMTPMQFLFSPRRWLEMIAHYGATAGAIPNFALKYCEQRIPPEQRTAFDLSSLRVLFVGAEPVIAQDLQHFEEAFAASGLRQDVLTPTFGLAECTLMVSARHAARPFVARRFLRGALARGQVKHSDNPADHRRTTLVGCGEAMHGHDIRIVDPNTRRACAGGRIGEIWVSGPSVAQGYWNRKTLSEQVFWARLAGGAQTYLRTGDLGFLDAGELFVTGRIKDLIILDGRKIHSEDIELTARQASPHLRDGSGAAFGLAFADGEGAALLHEVKTNQRVDWDKVISDVRLQVADVHDIALDAIAFIPLRTLPRTSSGKLQRSACRECYLAGDYTVVAEWRSGRGGALQ